MIRAGRIAACTWLALTASLSACSVNRVQSPLEPAGVQAAHIAALWWTMLIVLGAVFLLVLLFLSRAVARSPHLQHPDAPRIAPATDSRTWRGVAAAIAVSVITLFAVLVASLVTGARLAPPASTASGPITIEVVGHQWWWEVNYRGAEPQQTFTTANELHIPVGVPVTVRTTSRDVIHSFWVPDLAGKTDALPGRVNTFWLQADRAGMYRGQCAEFCGLQHARMAFHVVAQPQADFEQWLRGQRQPAAEPSTASERRGREVFLASPCALCHTVRGTPANAINGPDLTHVASRRFIAAGTLPNTVGNLAGWIVDSQGVKPGNHMPANELTPADLRALLAFLESLR